MDPILGIVVICVVTACSLVQLVWTWWLSRRIRAWLSDERTPLDISSFATFSRLAMAVWIAGIVLALFISLQAQALGLRNAGALDVMVLSIVMAIWCLIQLLVSRLSDTVCQLTRRFAATRSLVESGRLEEATKLLPEGFAPPGVLRETLARRLASLERISLIWQSVLWASLALALGVSTIEISYGFGSILLVGLAVVVPGIVVVVVVRFAVETRARRAQFLWFLALTTQKERPLAAELLAWGKSHRGRYGARVTEVAHDLAVGKTLADALQAQPKLMTPSDMLTIRVAEQTGALPGSLRDLAVRRTNELKGDPFTGVAIGTCLMLWMVLTVGCNIVGFLMYFIVPKFKVIFLGFGTELPGITVLLITASDFVVDSVILLSLLPLLSVLLLWTCGEAFFRGWSETWLAWVVGTGRRAEVPRLLRRLCNAVAAHQPWPLALKPMVLNHHRPGMRVRLERVLGRVTAGMSIWPSLRDAGLLTSRDVVLLEMAERANNLEWALATLAEAKDRALRHRWRVILTITAPVFTIAAGLFVFFVCIGFFMPLVKLLNDLS